MKNYVIGIDPDSERHGLAIYEDGKLITCATATVIEIVDSHLPMLIGNRMLVSIEDVMSNQFVYARNTRSNKTVQSKIAMHIGRCQQAQIELMRWLEHLNVEIVLQKPQSGNWAKNKAQFERITGWAGRSNEDSRSAAFFGYMALKQKRKV